MLKIQVVQVVRNGERVLAGDKQREIFVLQQKEGESGFSIIVDEYVKSVQFFAHKNYYIRSITKKQSLFLML